MWPFPNRSLFPPPTQAWLQTVSSDPEAQGWGAWNETKEMVGPEGGEEKEEEDEAEEDQDGDAGFLLSLLEQENLAECPVPDQELEAIKMKVCAMEQPKGHRGGVVGKCPLSGGAPSAGVLYCRKEPTSLGSAPQTAGAFADTQAPGGHPSPTAASRAGPGSDHEGRIGPVENSHHGFHRIKGKARF
uniref:PABPN1 like, cytoplasmic n=1 Tax=Nomascus leucogenys TaxID=61853 RepID=G1S0G3_NOMLE